MLTSNKDVCDNLTNRSIGVILDFFKDSKGIVKHVVVTTMDDPASGEEYRKQHNFESLYPGQKAIALQHIELDIKLGEGSTSSATATNCPLRLAWCSTCHKIQVGNVLMPSL